ncbi:MAG: hypothetical protein ABS55_07440 [Lautropia sp. SCN 70-15]|nr:MAG: hypothetical protein ABS55_07440 [Lautropia sp. SCN 70-15]
MTHRPAGRAPGWRVSVIDAPLIFWFLLLGSFTGVAAGLLGIGGGMLMVPFLTMLLSSRGFPIDIVVKVAIATSLTTILFTSLSSVRAHHKRGAVRWEIVRTLAPGMVVGSIAGAQVAHLLKGNLLAITFAVFVGFMATQMLFKREIRADRALPGPRGMLAAGGIIGVISAIVGAGGGFVTVPFLTRSNIRIHEAVATSAACGFPIALAGTLGYIIAGWNLQLPAGTVGYVYLPALVCIVATSMLTAPLGAKIAHAMSVAGLKRVFALLLYALCAYMLWKGLTG